MTAFISMPTFWPKPLSPSRFLKHGTSTVAAGVHLEEGLPLSTNCLEEVFSETGAYREGLSSIADSSSFHTKERVVSPKWWMRWLLTPRIVLLSTKETKMEL